jgi:hypothetical protein
MKGVMLVGVSACLLTLMMACGRKDDAPMALILETGCVTASGDEFILTDLEPGGSQSSRRPTTEAYLLSNADDALEEHVGERVRVTGDTSIPEVVNIRMVEPLYRARPDNGVVPATSNANQAEQPRVGVADQIRMKVGDLQVRSVEPTGDRCLDHHALTWTPQ